MDPLDADPVTVARVRDALARRALGGKYPAGGRALARERDLAAYLEGRYPGLGKMILAAYEFHRAALRWAVLGGTRHLPAPPAAGCVIAGAGFPLGVPLHARAAAARPAARYAYTAPDERITDVIAVQLAAPDPGRVAAVTARALDADAVLGSAPVKEMLAAGPVAVHFAMAPSRWPPEMARQALARYARLLPAGSTVCLSLVAGEADPQTGQVTAGGREMMDDASLAGGRGYPHTAADITSWLAGAGLRLPPGGVRPVRAFRRDWAAPYKVAARVPGRVLGAAAVKPPEDG